MYKFLNRVIVDDIFTCLNTSIDRYKGDFIAVYFENEGITLNKFESNNEVQYRFFNDITYDIGTSNEVPGDEVIADGASINVQIIPDNNKFIVVSDIDESKISDFQLEWIRDQIAKDIDKNINIGISIKSLKDLLTILRKFERYNCFVPSFDENGNLFDRSQDFLKKTQYFYENKYSTKIYIEGMCVVIPVKNYKFNNRSLEVLILFNQSEQRLEIMIDTKPHILDFGEEQEFNEIKLPLNKWNLKNNVHLIHKDLSSALEDSLKIVKYFDK